MRTARPPVPKREASRIDGHNGSGAAVLVALALYAGVLAGCVFVYRRYRFPVAYILTIAPIVNANPMS